MRWPDDDIHQGDHGDNTASQDKSRPPSQDNEDISNFIGPQILAQERRISVETFDQMHST